MRLWCLVRNGKLCARGIFRGMRISGLDGQRLRDDHKRNKIHPSQQLVPRPAVNVLLSYRMGPDIELTDLQKL